MLPARCLLVDPALPTDLSADRFATIAEAIAAASGAESRVVVLVRSGTYRETLSIGQPRLSLVGEVEGDATAVVIVYDNANPKPRGDGTTYGTAGSATVAVFAEHFRAKNLTIANDWIEGSDNAENPSANQAALALWALGDHLVMQHVRLVGNQDTLCADGNGSLDTLPTRQLYRDCYIEGDVDFIFGRATAVFSRCAVHATTARIGATPSYMTAASTDVTTLGYLFDQSEFTSDGAGSSFYLGRPWNSVVPESEVNAQVTVRDSILGGHVLATGWADWPGQNGTDLLAANMRYFEYANTGDGAVATTAGSRKVLSMEESASYTVETYLSDGADTTWYDTDRPGFWSE